MRHKDRYLMDRIYCFIDSFFEANRETPSTTTIANEMGIARSTAYNYLVEMSKDGLIEYIQGKPFTKNIKKTMTGREPVSAIGHIPCGVPTIEEESVLFHDYLPTAIFGKGPFYILYAEGDSMVDEGICDGDTLVIRRDTAPSIGDIIVAYDDTEGVNTLKKYAGIDSASHKAVLLYCNEHKYPGKTILVNQLVCQGVLSHVIKSY